MIGDDREAGAVQDHGGGTADVARAVDGGKVFGAAAVGIGTVEEFKIEDGSAVKVGDDGITATI